MTMTETELVDRVIQWVRQNSTSGRSADMAITSDTDLLAAGLIDSLGFVDLITFIESHEGCRIDLTDADPSDFAIVKGLCRIALKNSHQTFCQSPL
jgi:acyl carrier protein